MNRIQSLFEQKKSRILSFYCTAGFPGLEDTLPLLQELQAAGADMIEIGMPFSDPLADGPVIQQSSAVALANGMSIPELFRQLQQVRDKVHIPLLLMGYLNPVLQYGRERFCREAAACGIDGLIIPDLPPEEYEQDWKVLTEELGLNVVFLVAPATSGERIREIDRLSSGFIYLVTTAATTGGGIVVDEQVAGYFSRMQHMKLRNPLLAGFGISSPADFNQVCNYVPGAVIGSGLIRVLQQSNASTTAVQRYVHSFVEGFEK